MEEQRLLIDLDSLLDTRLATIAKIDPALAAKAAETNYRNRISDDFDELLKCSINEKFKEEYKKRDVDTLKHSRCTAAVLVMNEITQSWELLSQGTPFVDGINVDVNIWPYKLSEEEADAMVTAIMAYTSLDTRVEVVSIPHANLTPESIKDKWSVLMMYDFDGWLKEHTKALEKTKLPSITFIAPALFFNETPDEETLIKEEIKDINPFSALEFLLCEFLSLKLIDPKYFSIIEI